MKDELDEPLLVVDWRLSEFDRASFHRYLHVLRDLVERRRIGTVYYPTQGAPVHCAIEASHHHMGTTRMARSSAEGVVDKDCKVFELDNLYVAGSSVFPTGGNANPTLTLLALTRRLAHHVKDVMNRLPASGQVTAPGAAHARSGARIRGNGKVRPVARSIVERHGGRFVRSERSVLPVSISPTS